MHYHLPILMLVDILIVSERHDLLSQFPAQRTEAESAVLNTLIFGLNNKYSLHLPFGHNIHDQQVEDSRTRHSENSVSVPLVAIDPYPHVSSLRVDYMSRSHFPVKPFHLRLYAIMLQLIRSPSMWLQR